MLKRFLMPGTEETRGIPIEVTEVSKYGFQARSNKPLPLDTWFETTIQPGHSGVSNIRSPTLRGNGNGTDGFYGLSLGEPGLLWRKLLQPGPCMGETPIQSGDAGATTVEAQLSEHVRAD
jgi:hypothetical protein